MNGYFDQSALLDQEMDFNSATQFLFLTVSTAYVLLRKLLVTQFPLTLSWTRIHLLLSFCFCLFYIMLFTASAKTKLLNFSQFVLAVQSAKLFCCTVAINLYRYFKFLTDFAKKKTKWILKVVVKKVLDFMHEFLNFCFFWDYVFVSRSCAF